MQQQVGFSRGFQGGAEGRHQVVRQAGDEANRVRQHHFAARRLTAGRFTQAR